MYIKITEQNRNTGLLPHRYSLPLHPHQTPCMDHQTTLLNGSGLISSLTEQETWSQQYGTYAQGNQALPDNYQDEQEPDALTTIQVRTCMM